MFHKHRSILFPVVLIGLTLALAATVYFSVSPKSAVVPESKIIPVNDELYRNELTNIIQTFQTQYRSAPDDLRRLLLVEATLRNLLSLRVPAMYKELHLDLAVSLNLIMNGLRGEATLHTGGSRGWSASAPP